LVDRVEQARSFDRAAEEYERTRPDYPDAVLGVLPIGPEATVVDVGAGTGKLTRVLARHYARVLAVEPLDGMRAILEQVVPTAESYAGSAEKLPLPDASVDGAFAAQAFHWFANDEAVAEFARVLRPGGVLALIWNEGDDARIDPRPEAYRAYLEELHAPSLAAVRAGPPFRDLFARGPFGAVAEAAFPHDHVLDRSGMLDNVRSMSWIASKPTAEQEVVIARLGELVPEGTYAIPNVANVMWAVRR
jgi:ubiquinone/menaquinone biosynthesis C-methylase UbiE